MDEIQRDPIISFYVKMTKSTEYESVLPMFSETSLRLAFTHVLGKLRPLGTDELLLYKKLLLLHYAETYTTLDDLYEIMKCFTQEEVQSSIKGKEQLLEEWHLFANTHLRKVICKEALFEILYEWKSRYEVLHGPVNRKLLFSMTGEIQKFLGGSPKIVALWAKCFEQLLNDPNFSKTNDASLHHNLTEEDLIIEKIYEDIKHKFNSIVRENVVKAAQSHAQIEERKIQVYVPVVKRQKIDSGYERKHNAPIVQHNLLSPIKIKQEDSVEILHIVHSDSNAESDNEIYCEGIVKTEIVEEEGDVNVNCDAGNVGAEEEEDKKPPLTCVDHATASQYIAALQFYALVHNHHHCVGLLDKIDSEFRKKFT